MAYVTLFKLQATNASIKLEELGVVYLKLVFNTEDLIFTFGLLDKNNDPVATVSITAERGSNVEESEIRKSFVEYVSGYIMSIFNYTDFLWFNFIETHTEVSKLSTYKTVVKMLGDNEKYEMVMDHLSRLIKILVVSKSWKGV